MASFLVAESPRARRGTRGAAEAILAVILAVFAVAPLTYPGFFEAHSGFLPALNVAHITEAPHWGMPAGWTDGPRGEGRLPYLLVWPVFWLSGSGILAIKTGYALAFLLAAMGAFAWARRWYGPRAAVLAAVVYTYLPWHLSAVYVRGAYAEAWLWALMPLSLWAVEGAVVGRAGSRMLRAAVSLLLLAASFWTLPGLTVAFAAILAAGGLMIYLPGRRLWAGVALVAWVAVLTLMGAATQPARPEMSSHLLYPFQLLSAQWGYGAQAGEPGTGLGGGLSFQLGLVAVGLTIIAMALWLGRHRDRGVEQDSEDQPDSQIGLPVGRCLWFWVGVLLVVLLLTLRLAAFAWNVSALGSLVSYPWQLLALAGLPLSFLAGAVVGLDRRMAELPVWAGLVALTILGSYPYLAPRFSQVDPGPVPVALFQPAGSELPAIMLLDYEISYGVVGYSVADDQLTAEISRTLTVTLTWQAVEPLAHDYTVFVHVLSGDGAKVAQQDTRPCGGLCPTDEWAPGAIAVDAHRLVLAADARQPPYRLALGLYLLASGDRVAVAGREDATVFFDVP
jgi:hypothetical protein